MKLKMLYLALLSISLLLLTGCTIDISTDEKSNQNNSEDSEKKNTNQNNEEQQAESEEVEDVEEETEQNTQETEQEEITEEEQAQEEMTENPTQGDLNQSQVYEILETYGSMFISSMRLDAHVEAVQTNMYQESPLTWDSEVYINLSSEITTHEQITLSDGKTEDVNVEVYSHPTVMYLNIEDTSWTESENKLGSYRHYYWINSEIINHFAQRSDLFVGYDDGTHYRLEFTGSDQQFEELVFFAFPTILDDTLNSYYVSEGGNISGKLSMSFEKGSNRLTDYTLAYEATTTVPDEGEYSVKETGEYKLSEFGQHNSLTISSEVDQ